MGNGVFNVAKGRAVELHNRVNDNDPATAGLIVVLLKVTEADATLQDYATLNAVLAAAGNTEADFTAYAQKTLTDTEISAATLSQGTDTYSCDVPDQTWTSAGGTLDNTLAKLLVCYAPDTGGADTTFIPLTFHDFIATTDGTDLIATVHVDGYYQAT